MEKIIERLEELVEKKNIISFANRYNLHLYEE